MNELLPDEETFREKEEDRQAAPGTWIQRPEKRREYKYYRDYSEQNDIDTNQDLDSEEDASEDGSEHLDEPQFISAEERALSKTAKDWIRQFQSTHDRYEARRDQQGNRIPKTDWLLRLLAVRSLVNARPGDKSFYGRMLSIEDVNRRAEALAQDPDMRKFLESLKASPAVYASAVEYAEKGAGSGLDTWVKKYMAVKGLAPTGMLMARYLPSAELRVDAMKVLLKKRGTSPENRLDFVSQIVASRLTLDARRGGFTGMDERMKEAPGSEDFMQCRDAAKAALEKLSPNQLNGLLRKAQEGHGGKLLESFSELTGVNAANWRDQAEPDAREAGEELRGLSL
ncbi:MAG: hypothetical protein IKI02_09100 [Oscillospiraceae bacterium]|nr:hypothetical protein [Oscillospiraceae bacterium]